VQTVLASTVVQPPVLSDSRSLISLSCIPLVLAGTPPHSWPTRSAPSVVIVVHPVASRSSQPASGSAFSSATDTVGGVGGSEGSATARARDIDPRNRTIAAITAKRRT
jgi:hypothetical protein